MRLLLLFVVFLFVAAPADAALRLERVGRFHEPVFVTAGPGGRPVVVERRGRLRSARTGRVLVDLRTLVIRPRGGEMVDQRGLFSAVYRNGRYYVEYVDKASRLRVDEIRGRRFKHLLDFGVVGQQHHGGQLAFGSDGLLYIGVGGRIMRARVGEAATVFAEGLRNPWRFSFSGGSLIVGDVGENETETISVYPPGSVALTLPHPEFCAVIGGYVWRGRYWYGDLCSGRVWSARLAGSSLVGARREGKVFYLVSFGLVRGRLYAVSFGGAVYRVRG